MSVSSVRGPRRSASSVREEPVAGDVLLAVQEAVHPLEAEIRHPDLVGVRKAEGDARAAVAREDFRRPLRCEEHPAARGRRRCGGHETCGFEPGGPILYRDENASKESTMRAAVSKLVTGLLLVLVAGVVRAAALTPDPWPRAVHDAQGQQGHHLPAPDRDLQGRHPHRPRCGVGDQEGRKDAEVRRHLLFGRSLRRSGRPDGRDPAPQGEPGPLPGHHARKRRRRSPESSRRRSRSGTSSSRTTA